MDISRTNRSRLRVESLEDRTLLTAGVLDPTFGAGGLTHAGFTGFNNDTANAEAIQADGKIVIVGSTKPDAKRFASRQDFEVARLNTDGTLDVSFGVGGHVATAISDGDSEATGVVIQSDGKIVVVGRAVSSSMGQTFAVVRFNSDGSLDASFGSGGKVLTTFADTASPVDLAKDVAIQADGKIIVSGGASRHVSGAVVTDAALARYNANGSLDPSFGTGGKVTSPGSEAIGVDLQSDGKVVILEDSAHQLVRLDANGAIDPGFGSGGSVVLDFTTPNFMQEGRGLAIEPDGSIVVVAQFLNDASVLGKLGVGRYTLNGTPDASFGTNGKVALELNGTPHAYGPALQSDGKIVVATTAETYRFTPNGSLDSTWGSNGKAPIGGAAVAVADDKVVLVAFGLGNPQFTYIAARRLLSSGQLDMSFGVNGLVLLKLSDPSWTAPLFLLGCHKLS